MLCTLNSRIVVSALFIKCILIAPTFTYANNSELVEMQIEGANHLSTLNYNRNTNDRNNNGIRDDIDAVINEMSGRYKRKVLSHFAYFSNKFMNSNPSNEFELLGNMSEMMEAVSCTDINREISTILGIQLDTQFAHRQYLSMENAYAKSRFAHYVFNDNCKISPNSLALTGKTSIELALEENSANNLSEEYELDKHNYLPTQGEVTFKHNGSLTLEKNNVYPTRSSDKWRYIIYINGMFTRFLDAARSSEEIEKRFAERGQTNVRVSTAHNNNEEWEIQV